jgi:hypothetical protein
MIGLFCFVLTVRASPFKSKLRLEAENAVLRDQLNVLRRRLHSRPAHQPWSLVLYPAVTKPLAQRDGRIESMWTSWQKTRQPAGFSFSAMSAVAAWNNLDTDGPFSCPFAAIKKAQS